MAAVRHLPFYKYSYLVSWLSQNSKYAFDLCTKCHRNRTIFRCDMTISRQRISAILNFEGWIMGHLKSPCRTSYRSSLETIALNSHCRILSPDKTEWRLISATLCGWRRCFVADQFWLTTRIQEELLSFWENCVFFVRILARQTDGRTDRQTDEESKALLLSWVAP